jgi:hypothetical protein
MGALLKLMPKESLRKDMSGFWVKIFKSKIT